MKAIPPAFLAILLLPLTLYPQNSRADGFYPFVKSQTVFEAKIAEVKSVYGPKVAAEGRKLTLAPDWESTREIPDMSHGPAHVQVAVPGAFFRLKELTLDGFQLALCHEIGHALGGAPQKRDVPTSLEGQADYFATLRCAREIWPAIAVAEPHPRCVEAFPTDGARAGLCTRSLAAAESLTRTMWSMDLPAKPMPSIATPSSEIVETTNTWYPSDQCRLDTLVAGAVCASADGSACESGPGARPSCWYRAEGR